jgi:signal transduction histidine kinase
MPREDTHIAGPSRATGTAGGAGTAPRSLVWLLAQAARQADLLPHLHQQALERAGGQCSLLFQHNPRNGLLQATSGFGLDLLRADPWLPEPEEGAIVASAFDRSAPLLVPDAAERMPDLSARLGSTSALLVPLVRGSERAGLLAIGYATAPMDLPDDLSDVAGAFLVALELFQFRQRDELQRDVRALLDEFSSQLSSTLNLPRGVELFCHGANMLFGANRTSVWVHDRRARSLLLQASSDSTHAGRDMRVSVDDGTAPAAAAMRRARAEIVPGSGEDATVTLTVPLRGTRRALGTIVFEGVRVAPGGELDLLDRADELGRQLSSAIENMQLLDDLIRSRRELENTFDSITHLVAVADRRGHLTHVNQPFAARAGRTRAQLIDQPLATHVGSELSSWIAQLESTAGSRPAEAPATRELFDPVLKGQFMVTVSDLVDHGGDRLGSVIVARDLTPQTRLEAEREELRRRLTQTEKLAALGQFVAGIAHELNNPLQGVLGHLELLRVTGAFPKQIRREVQTIYREADRAAKIVRNLLVFAGSRRLARRSVSVNAVLQKVLALRAASCRAQDIELVRHYDDKLPRVKSDPLLLHQVFLNMVMNAEHAIAAKGRGGRIEITTSVTPARDRVVATVRDTGTGIAEDTLSRIFEPFYTTKEVGKGTGLGLAIAYGIVQEHGGQILAANHPEGGAVFTVELPTAAPPARARAHD